MSRGITSVSSAPGKLILLGEHAVVYGKTAVATCLSALRVKVTAVRCVCAPPCLRAVSPGTLAE
jgi:hypothetical protein